MGKRRGKAAKKARQSQLLQGEGKELVEAPHSFVIHRGKVGKHVVELVKDMRRVMAPYTAEDLKVKKKNKFKDFISVAGPLHVTHMMMFTKTEKSVNFRLCRMPRGPTLTFQVKSYCLVRDVLSTVNRHNMEPKQFNHHPLLVMNNFKGDDVQVKLMASMFQNLFPSINVDKVKLNNIRRCVLLNYDAETMQIEFRHYNIRVAPVGVGRAVRKIVQSKVPNLSTMADISEYVMNAGNMSESEAEQDGPENKVVLPQNISGRGNIKSSQSAVRLTEIGPRMMLKLVKIEEGLCSGSVMYHALVKRTPEELESAKRAREQKRLLKAQRRAQQEAQVKRKAALKREQQSSSRAAASAGDEADDDDECAADSDVEGNGASDSQNVAEVEDDDAAFYRQEVGSEPDADLFPAARPGIKRMHRQPGSKGPRGVQRRRVAGSKDFVRKPRNTDRESNQRPGQSNRRRSNGEHAPATGQFKQWQSTKASGFRKEGQPKRAFGIGRDVAAKKRKHDADRHPNKAAKKPRTARGARHSR